MARKYQKFGLRRDRNLADVASPNLALANLLDNLSNETFVPEDLKVIDGLRNTTLTSEDLKTPNGSVQDFTTTDESGNIIVTPFTPLITLQDRINNFKIFLGDPPFTGGGDGLLATFIPWDACDTIWDGASESQKKAFRGDQIFDSNYTPPNDLEPPISAPQDFWDNGSFFFGSFLSSEFTDTYGAVQWEGYAESDTDIELITSGLLKIEYDFLDDDNWTFIKNIYDEKRAVSFSNNVIYNSGTDETVLELQNSNDHLIIALADRLTFEDISNTAIADISDNFYTVTQVSPSGTITVRGDATANNTIAFPANGTVFFELSEDEINTGNIRTPTTFDGDYIKLRITYWFPDFEDGRPFSNKVLYHNDNDTDVDIPYTKFFQELPNRAASQESYEFFEENRLSRRKKLSSNTNVDAESTTALETNRLIFANYTPPIEVPTANTEGRYYGNAPATYLGNAKFSFDSNPYSVKVGDFLAVVSNTDVHSVIVEDFSDQNEIFIKPSVADAIDFTVDETYTIHAFDSTGLISLTIGTANNATTATISNMGANSEVYSESTAVDDLRDDYLTAGIRYTGGNEQFTHFKRLTKTSASTIELDTFYTGDSFIMTNGHDYIFATYASSGLENLTAISQCQGTFGREVASPAASGQRDIVLTSVDGVSTGQFVQFGNTSANTTYVSSYIPANTTVTSINSNTITLSTDILTTIPQSATIVFIESDPGTTAKEFCVLPLNTAPPFEGTDEGLRTPGSFENLNVQNLAFGELSLYDVKVENLINLESSSTYTEVIGIDHDSTEYKLLIE